MRSQRHLRLLALLAGGLLFAAGCLPAPAGIGWNWAGPSLDQNALYVATYTGKVIALDQAGAFRWEFSAAKENEAAGHSTIYGRPAATANAIYVGSYNGTVYRLDPTTGARTWERAIGAPVVAAPTADETTAFVASGDGKLRALNAADGKTRWEFATKAAVWAAPTLVEGTLYVASMDHHLYAVDAATGRQRWRFAAQAPLLTQPIVADGAVYVGGMGATLYRVDATSGRSLDTFTAGNWLWAEPIVANGTVYAASLDHRLYLLDARTLQPKREPFVADGQIRSAPAHLSEAGIVVVASPSGESAGKVYGLDAATGQKRWEQLLDSPAVAPLAVAEETTYVTTAHAVYAFDSAGRTLWEYRFPVQK